MTQPSCLSCRFCAQIQPAVAEGDWCGEFEAQQTRLADA